MKSHTSRAKIANDNDENFVGILAWTEVPVRNRQRLRKMLNLLGAPLEVTRSKAPKEGSAAILVIDAS